MKINGNQERNCQNAVTIDKLDQREGNILIIKY